MILFKTVITINTLCEIRVMSLGLTAAWNTAMPTEPAPYPPCPSGRVKPVLPGGQSRIEPCKEVTKQAGG